MMPRFFDEAIDLSDWNTRSCSFLFVFRSRFYRPGTHKGVYHGKNSKRHTHTICIRRGGTEATKEASQARSETDAGNRGSEKGSNEGPEAAGKSTGASGCA